MAVTRVFISHDTRDTQLASVLSGTLSRITLGQIQAWLSSDESKAGGLKPGSVWLDEVREHLRNAEILLVLLTPRSVESRWLHFETGFVASRGDCEVIPVAIGIDSVTAVPFPLGMYQIFQIADYDSLKRFTGKLLTKTGIPFDEEMIKPILQKSVGEFARLATFADELERSEPQSQRIIDAVTQHIDRALLRITNQNEPVARTRDPDDDVYSIKVFVELSGEDTVQYLTIGRDTTIQDILDKTYQILRPEVDPFKYLERWILRERGTGLGLIVREITARIPASPVLPPGSEWEVEWLKRPYDATDSEDFSRWYRRDYPGVARKH